MKNYSQNVLSVFPLLQEFFNSELTGKEIEYKQETFKIIEVENIKPLPILNEGDEAKDKIILKNLLLYIVVRIENKEKDITVNIDITIKCIEPIFFTLEKNERFELRNKDIQYNIAKID